MTIHSADDTRLAAFTERDRRAAASRALAHGCPRCATGSPWAVAAPVKAGQHGDAEAELVEVESGAAEEIAAAAQPAVPPDVGRLVVEGDVVRCSSCPWACRTQDLPALLIARRRPFRVQLPPVCPSRRTTSHPAAWSCTWMGGGRIKATCLAAVLLPVEPTRMIRRGERPSFQYIVCSTYWIINTANVGGGFLDATRPRLPRGHTELAVLEALAKSPMFLQGLIRTTGLSQGQVSGALARLRRGGYVRASDQPLPVRGHGHGYYLEERGKRLLAALREELAQQQHNTPAVPTQAAGP